MICSLIVVMTVGEQSIMGYEKTTNRKIYKNPVIHADYSDPDVTASPDGDIFYMTASSFQSVPGLSILKSKDLVNWEIVNYALKEVVPAEIYGDGKTHHGKGVWAPSIKYHNGEYYIYWGDPDFGIFMVKTENPEGEWTDPIMVRPGKGLIDPTPFWDENGKAYLANGWAASRAGFNSVITISEMSPDGERVITEPVIVYDANDGINHTMEGPKMYKKEGYYYLFAPAGGVENGWQVVMRSKNIYGPYEAKIVMAQGTSDINGPHQGAWVTTNNNEDWFLHFQDKGAYGRVVHLNPLKWENGWPVIGIDKDGDGIGEPVDEYYFPVEIEDKNIKMPIEMGFQWHANKNDFFGFKIPDGFMRLYSHKLSDDTANLWEVGNLWLMKFPKEEFSFITDVKISSKAVADGVSSGIIIMGYDYCRLGLTIENRNFILQIAECKDAENGGKEDIRNILTITPDRLYEAGLIPNIEKEIRFKVTVNSGAECKFFYSIDKENYIELPELFKARQGKWIGAKIGFYNIMPPDQTERGWIDIKDVIIE